MSSSSAESHRGIRLSNTVHSEIAPCLPLPSLPVFCGAQENELQLFDEPRSLNRNDVLAQAGKIAELLQATDISYLNLHNNLTPKRTLKNHLQLHEEVLRSNPDAFQCNTAGSLKEMCCRSDSTASEPQHVEQNPSLIDEATPRHNTKNNYSVEHKLEASSSSSKKTRLRKKANDDISTSSGTIPSERQGAIIESFCELLEEICGRAEVPADDRDEEEWLLLPISDVRKVVNEIMSIRSKKILHMVPVDFLVRLLKVLDNQIHGAEGLSFTHCEHSDSDVMPTILSALESIHAALAVMAHNDMPKPIYKEEIIERILEFCRRQIMDVISANDPSYIFNKQFEDAEEDEEFDPEASMSKKRRTNRTKYKKSVMNKVSAAGNSVMQKLCTILGFLKDLLVIERLSDSCILQLVKTSFTTFLVDNMKLMQLKSISLISAIFSSYTQHRGYVIDEVLQVLWKLPSSKRVLRTYHLPDEEQIQIQMITALLIQLVQSSANVPGLSASTSAMKTIVEYSFDADYIAKYHEAVTEACCLFWSRILQRFSSVKSQEASEVKMTIDNLVIDLLTTLNLPEYPASATILEVLCVLLLQNAGLKSKDTSSRIMAIDVLGTIAARLKHDTVRCRNDKFWITRLFLDGKGSGHGYPKDRCSICSVEQADISLFTCQDCKRLFHSDCMGINTYDVPARGWYCPLCQCQKQLLALQAYCKTQCQDNGEGNLCHSENISESSDSVAHIETIQQMLLNFLLDAAADAHVFTSWFYLLMWYKDEQDTQKKLVYCLARVKLKTIVRDSGLMSSLLTRTSIKKITLAMGQKSSFFRGFDKILFMLLASLRENSPLIRAKALRSVSIIVEADPEVLCEKGVQLAVEGRFCDSAISVREAALELVGRHIASHSDVGLKYFEKVSERIKDTGVSVRKRAIRIIRDMCTSNSNFSEFTTACLEIMSRASDDEASIQDLVCKTFFEFWFEENTGFQTQYFSDESSIPLEVCKKTEQIVETLRRMSNHQLLVSIIRRNLALDFFPQSAKASGINPVSLASVRKRCELICKCLLERMLQVEESSGGEVEKQTLPYVMALHAFCTVDPTLCAPASDPSLFVITLQPYLKSNVDNRIVAQQLESIIFVIDAILPLLRKLPQMVVEELEQDLKHMIVRHSFLTVVHACIKCLCAVSKVAGKGVSVIEHLIQVFFKRLAALAIDNKQQIGRSIFCLGLLIRYGTTLLHGSCSEDKNLDVLSSLNIFKKHLYMEDFVVRIRSLQALGFVLIAKPEYMLERDIGKIVEAALSPKSDFRIKMQALQNIFEYLLDAENQMGSEKVSENDVIDHSRSSRHGVPSAAGAGDNNICGGIIQFYWDKILSTTLDANTQVRGSALKIVDVVLRQGLVHPITCVPCLIALVSDPHEVNSKLAYQLLTNMNEKYPSFFESRLGDGLQMSFVFMQALSGSPETDMRKSKHRNKEDESSFTSGKLGASRIYRLIRGNRVSRNKFMSSVVRKFDSPSWKGLVIPFLMYCTEILAFLPFTSPDEPLYLIYALNRIIQVKAAALEASMKALSLNLVKGESKNEHSENGGKQEPLGNTGTAPVDDANGSFNHQNPVPNPSPPLNPEELHKLQVDSLAAIALQLVLKLKRHLKMMYGLNDERCQAFSPNEPLKPGESLSKQNVPFDIKDTRNSLPTTYQEFIQMYQEFKHALKEDTIDYSTYTTSVKRKRPPSTRTAKVSRMKLESDDDDNDNDNNDDDDDWENADQGVPASSTRISRTRSRRQLS